MGKKEAPQTKFTKARKAKFLEAYRESGHKERSAKAVGVHYATVRTHLQNDEDFRAAFQLCEELVAMDFETDVMRHHALGGHQTPVVQQGKVVKDDNGEPIMISQYDSKLILAYAAAIMPDRYGNKSQLELSGTGGVLVVPEPLGEEGLAKKFDDAD